MTFLHPLALLGLAAAAIPALLHLLERRVPPELEFPPLRYLSDAERRSARRLKLRHLLLLVLRTALIVVVVLAAARPLVPARGGGRGGGAHQPTALVVILDNSLSSGAVVDGRPVLDRLRVVAHTSIARASPADRVWLVLADGVIRGGSREALLAAVESVTAAPRRLALVGAVERAARLADGEPLAAREVHLASDLQRTALDSGAARIPGGVRVLALAPPPPRLEEAPLNRGIAAARVVEGAVVVSVAGTPGAGPAPVTVRVGGREVARTLAAPAGSVAMPLPPASPGWWLGEVVLEADELRADDRRLFAWRVAPPARVSAEPPSGTGPFLDAALAVLREARRVGEGTEVVIAERPRPGKVVVLPPTDPALLGQANRALAAQGIAWRFAGFGTPGPLDAPDLDVIRGVPVTRRYRLEGGDSGGVVATVNGEPWLVHDRRADVVVLGSRLDTAWTALPATPGFVPFVDALVNRVARGEAPVTEADGAARVVFATRGADTVGATVYAPDPRESDLTPAPRELARRALGAEVLDEADFAAARFAGTRRADLSGLLLALALLVAAAELGVATLTR